MDSLAVLLARADDALYQDKASGRSRSLTGLRRQAFARFSDKSQVFMG
jgi:hypothetical protein